MNFDVIIIGASSSGLYAAALLAQEGKRVGVFDRQQDINPARRTYIITPQIKAFLEEISVQVELYQTRVMAVDSCKASVVIPLREPDLIIERNLLSQELLTRAAEAGAEIYTSHRFLGFDHVEEQTKLIFDTAGSEIDATASVVIGADGFKSQTAKAAGISLPQSVPIVQAEIELPKGWDSGVAKVWFDVDDTRFFYWLIPESVERGVLGLAGQDARQIRSLLDRFLGRLALQALRYQASQVAMHHPGLQPWGKAGTMPVYLIGDAAGQVKVTTVGGTVSGFGARVPLFRQSSKAPAMPVSCAHSSANWICTGISGTYWKHWTTPVMIIWLNVLRHLSSASWGYAAVIRWQVASGSCHCENPDCCP